MHPAAGRAAKKVVPRPADHPPHEGALALAYSTTSPVAMSQSEISPFGQNQFRAAKNPPRGGQNPLREGNRRRGVMSPPPAGWRTSPFHRPPPTKATGETVPTALAMKINRGVAAGGVGVVVAAAAVKAWRALPLALKGILTPSGRSSITMTTLSKRKTASPPPKLVVRLRPARAVTAPTELPLQKPAARPSRMFDAAAMTTTTLANCRTRICRLSRMMQPRLPPALRKETRETVRVAHVVGGGVAAESAVPRKALWREQSGRKRGLSMTTTWGTNRRASVNVPNAANAPSALPAANARPGPSGATVPSGAHVRNVASVRPATGGNGLIGIVRDLRVRGKRFPWTTISAGLRTKSIICPAKQAMNWTNTTTVKSGFPPGKKPSACWWKPTSPVAPAIPSPATAADAAPGGMGVKL